MSAAERSWKENCQAVAIHDFDKDATDERDLKLKVGDIITVVKLTKDEKWLKARALDGRVGLVPTTHIRKRGAVRLHSFAWFHGRIERERAEDLLKLPPLVDGKYLVRESIRYYGDYTLSLLTIDPVTNEKKIDHYRMLRNPETSTVYIDEDFQFDHVYEIINFYKKQAAGLAHKLTVSVDSSETKIKVSKEDFERNGWTISPDDVKLEESIGSGEFAEVWRGSLRGCTVAVKQIKKQEESEKLLAEASMMTDLKHPNLLRLIAITTVDPIMMLVEYCDKGSLLDVLRTQGRQVITIVYLLDFARGVLDGMCYLESRSLQHRDLACRNVLVDDQMQAKISDFGLAQNRNVTLESGKFPIKWSAPEAVNEKKYTNKSDVWSYGVFLWELFSYGRVPYPNMQKEEVVKNVMRGHRMSQPTECPQYVYQIMLNCWTIDVERRPSFKQLRQQQLTDKQIRNLKNNEHSVLPIKPLNLEDSNDNTYETLDSISEPARIV